VQEASGAPAAAAPRPSAEQKEWQQQRRQQRQLAAQPVQTLNRMEVMVEQVSLFLTRDGVVISLFSSPISSIAERLLERTRVCLHAAAQDDQV
jgi:hypothetical protein